MCNFYCSKVLLILKFEVYFYPLTLPILIFCLWQICQEFNSTWAWEMEKKGYLEMSVECKLGILKVHIQLSFWMLFFNSLAWISWRLGFLNSLKHLATLAWRNLPWIIKCGADLVPGTLLVVVGQAQTVMLCLRTSHAQTFIRYFSSCVDVLTVFLLSHVSSISVNVSLMTI